MVRRCILLLIPGVLFLISTGCTNMTMLRTKELREVGAGVDSLRNELVALQKIMYEEQKAQSELVRLMRADQQLRFGEIDRKVSEIASNLNENQFRISKIGETTAEFQKKFEARLAADSLAGSSRDAEIEKLFQIAMSDFNAGRYDVAVKGFQDLVGQFPESPSAQDAEYWLAECHYARRSWRAAEQAYVSYVKKYPQGARLCVALYKLGLAYEKQDKGKSRTMVWKKALEQCPDSPEIQTIRLQMK